MNKKNFLSKRSQQMEKLPPNIENKIFYYLSHPITDVLRNKTVILRKLKTKTIYGRPWRTILLKTSYVNFTEYGMKGYNDVCILSVYTRDRLYQILWKSKVSNCVKT